MAKRWTQAEKYFLRANYGKMTNAKLAAALGRSIDAVRRQCARLGLKGEQCKIEITKTIRDYKFEYQPGDTVRVTFDAQHKNRRNVRIGRVLEVYDRFVLIQFEGWRECINLGCLISGDAKVELLKRRKAA